MSYTLPAVSSLGKTFAQLGPLGLSGLIEAYIAGIAATNPPAAAPTVSATGGGASGGLLQAGTYYGVYTEHGNLGETTPSPVTAQFTVAAGNIPQVTFASLQAGNTARSFYLGVANGPATGPFYRYSDNFTATTLNLATAYNANNGYAYTPPTTNLTGLTQGKIDLIRAEIRGDAKALRTAIQAINAFDRGNPVSLGEALRKLMNAASTHAIILQAINDAIVLLNVNGGHFGTATDGIGNRKPVRLWP